MDVILIPLYELVDSLLWLYLWILIISVIMSWLIAFGVVNTNNQFISIISEFLYRATEPVLRPIRRKLPDMGGLDLSPLVLLLAIQLVRGILGRLVMHLMGVM